jgi:hypothetical protein
LLGEHVRRGAALLIAKATFVGLVPRSSGLARTAQLRSACPCASKDLPPFVRLVVRSPFCRPSSSRMRCSTCTPSLRMNEVSAPHPQYSGAAVREIQAACSIQAVGARARCVTDWSKHTTISTISEWKWRKISVESFANSFRLFPALKNSYEQGLPSVKEHEPTTRTRRTARHHHRRAAFWPWAAASCSSHSPSRRSALALITVGCFLVVRDDQDIVLIAGLQQLLGEEESDLPLRRSAALN